MARNFSSQLAGQIGESLVVSELGRRGIIATTFAGNVPDIDILAYRDGVTLHIQVKAWREGDVSFNALRFIQIEFEGNTQTVTGIDDALDPNLTYVFVKIGEKPSLDRYFILRQSQLQSLVHNSYSAWLADKGGIRPRNPTTTHTAVRLIDLLPF